MRSLPRVLCYIILPAVTHMLSVSRYLESLGAFILTKVRPLSTYASLLSSCFSTFCFHKESISLLSLLLLRFLQFFFFLICLQAQLNICSIPLVLIMYSKNPYRHNLAAHQRADSCAFLISHIISCVFVTFSFIIQTQKRQFKCGSGDLPRPRILFFNKGGVQSIILKVPDWKGIEPGIFS